MRPSMSSSTAVVARCLCLTFVCSIAPTLQLAAQTGPAEGKEGLVELSRFDERLNGHYAPKGFKVQIIAAEPTIVDPTGMAFDDQGNLYVSEWKFADHMLDTVDTLKLPEGGATRVVRRRKSTTDQVKRLIDRDHDGVYEAAEVVVDGCEMPANIFPWKNSLYLTCVGRLERWSDEDGDGKFEQRTISADGFCGFYHHWLSGMALNADGWFYLTAGDNDNHVVGSDGSRVEVSRCGGVFRGKIDGSRMHFFAMGFRNPYRDLAFNSAFDPFLVDNDQEEGSKFQGVRLINPVEGGDYGWRLRQGAFCCQTDFDRGAVNGELPGKLPIIAKTGRGAPAGMVVYNGTAFPESYRDVVIYPDVFRKLVRGYRVTPKGGSYALKEEITLMTADDDLFRPCHAVIGADGALYVVDWRSNSGGAGRLWGDGKWGRIYKITWEGDGQSPALALKENNWRRVVAASDAQLLGMIHGRDFPEARRAQRELVSRGDGQRPALLALMGDLAAPLHVRLLGLQGARQLWNEEVAARMLTALDDRVPEVRRLAAQALSWEPADRRPELVPRLVAHLNDPDERALRDIALAIGRLGWAIPFDAAPPLLAWLLAHPQHDAATRDAFIRALEQIGDPGVEAVARAVRTPDEPRRSRAVAVFTALRTEPAARRLFELATFPGLDDTERTALIRQFKDIPLNIPLPTQSLAEWVSAHPGLGPEVKVATLDVCRLGGNPAPALVSTLLDDRDESVRLSATMLASQSRPEGAVAKLAARLADPSRSTAERLAIARALRGVGAAVFPALEVAYGKVTDDASLRRTLLRSMADNDRDRTTPIAERALGEGADLRAEALQILSESPQSSLVLGRAFLDGKLARGDLPAVLQAVRRYNSAEHKELLSKIEEALQKGLAAISVPDLKARVQRGADPWAGLGVYLRETGSRCYVCHKIENFGSTVGPALTGVYQALSLDKLIESMLEPSKEIKEGYEAYKVALKDGTVLTGIKVSQDATSIVLKEGTGQETRVAIADIEEQAKDPNSLMPVGLLYDLAPEDLANLLAFLMSKPAQDTLKNRRRLEHFVAAGPFPPGADGSHLPLGRVDAGQTFSGQGATTLSWVILDASGRGNLNLRGHFGLNPGRAYLATHVRSDVDQDAAIRIAIDGATRLYANGAKIGEVSPQTRVDLSTATNLRLALRAGWNTLLFAIDRPVNGEGQALIEIGTAEPVDIQARRP